MKINLSYIVTGKKTRTVECIKYIQVPGWVWPFDCVKCLYDIEPNDMQVIAVPKGEPHMILHYHVKCWEEVQER